LKRKTFRTKSKGINKKFAITFVARKLLVLIYTLWKNDTEYIQNYKRTKPENKKFVACKA